MLKHLRSFSRQSFKDYRCRGDEKFRSIKHGWKRMDYMTIVIYHLYRVGLFQMPSLSTSKVDVVVSVVVMICAKFEVLNTIIGWVFILVINYGKVLRVWNERISDEPMNIKIIGFSILMKNGSYILVFSCPQFKDTALTMNKLCDAICFGAIICSLNSSNTAKR